MPKGEILYVTKDSVGSGGVGAPQVSNCRAWPPPDGIWATKTLYKATQWSDEYQDDQPTEGVSPL